MNAPITLHSINRPEGWCWIACRGEEQLATFYDEGAARLFAAAPGILAALERCLRYGDLLDELRVEAEAAIAAAKAGVM